MKQQSSWTRKEQINARGEAPLRSPYVCVSTCRNPWMSTGERRGASASWRCTRTAIQFWKWYKKMREREIKKRRNSTTGHCTTWHKKTERETTRSKTDARKLYTNNTSLSSERESQTKNKQRGSEKGREKASAPPSSALPRWLYNISYRCTLPWIFISLR